MRILLNGETREMPDGLTVRELLELLDFSEGPVAVERNRDVVPRAQHGSVRLSDGDMVEIVHFVGGG